MMVFRSQSFLAHALYSSSLTKEHKDNRDLFVHDTQRHLKPDADSLRSVQFLFLASPS